MSKVVVTIVVLRKELRAFEMLLESIRKGSVHPDLVVILRNGFDDDLDALADTSFPHCEVLSSEVALGVASARNYINTQRFINEEDLIVQLDSDTVVSPHYFEYLKKKYLPFPQKIGILGPAIIDHRELELESSNGQDYRCFSIKMLIEKNLDHIGTNRHYDWTYFGTKNKLWLGSKDLRRNPIYRTLASLGIRFRVGNVAGAGQIYTKGTFLQLQGFRQEFDPYGLEDVDFSIRCAKMGMTILTDPRLVLFHRTDRRHRSLEHEASYRSIHINTARTYGLLWEFHIQNGLVSLFDTTLLANSEHGPLSYLGDPSRSALLAHRLCYGFLLASDSIFKSKSSEALKGEIESAIETLEHPNYTQKKVQDVVLKTRSEITDMRSWRR